MHTRRGAVSIGLLIVILAGCQPPVVPPTAPALSSDPSATVGPEIVGTVPWGAATFPQQIVPTGTGLGRQGMRMPDLLQAADESLWLRMDQRLVGLDGTLIDLEPALGTQRINSVVAVGDQFLAVLLVNDHVALLLVDRQGQVVAKHTMPTPLIGKSRGLRLLRDATTDIAYLFVSTETTAVLLELNLQTGETRVAHQFAPYLPDEVWVRDGQLYWREYQAQANRQVWQQMRLADQTLHTLADSPLEIMFSTIHGPLPGGGAMLDGEKSALVLMGADGAMQTVLPFDALRPQEIAPDAWGIRGGSLLVESASSMVLVGADVDQIYVVRVRFP